MAVIALNDIDSKKSHYSNYDTFKAGCAVFDIGVFYYTYRNLELIFFLSSRHRVRQEVYDILHIFDTTKYADERKMCNG